MNEPKTIRGCPLCGTRPVITFGKLTNVITISCPACHLHLDGELDPYRAIRKWNQRYTTTDKKFKDQQYDINECRKETY